MRRAWNQGWRWVGMAAFVALFALVPMAVTTTSVAAQEREEDCRCVDRDGNPVDDCVCMSTPARSFSLYRMAGFERRSIIGVTIDYEQESDVDAEGAVIREVQAGGPADDAGLRAGDIVVRVDGRSVFDPLDRRAERRLSEDQSLPVQRFVRLVGALEPGETIEVEYVRDGRVRTTTLTPDEATASGFPLAVYQDALPGLRLRFDEDGVADMLEEVRGQLRGDGWTEASPNVFQFRGPGEDGEVRFFQRDGTDGEPFGLRFRDELCVGSVGDRGGVFVFGGTNCVDGVEFIELNEGLGEYFGTDEGVLVSEVADESPLGLRAGDVLMAIDGRQVRSPEHALRILGSYESDEEVRLRVMRRGSETEVLGRRR